MTGTRSTVSSEDATRAAVPPAAGKLYRGVRRQALRQGRKLREGQTVKGSEGGIVLRLVEHYGQLAGGTNGGWAHGA